MVSTPPVSQRRSRISDRGFFDFIGNSLNGESRLPDIAKRLTDALSLQSYCLSQCGSFNKTLTPFDFDQKLNLFKQSLSCPPVEAQLLIDLEAKAHADVTIVVAASGTISPPAVSELAFITSDFLFLFAPRMVLNILNFIGMTADLDGIISMNGGATGAVDSGEIKLYGVGSLSRSRLSRVIGSPHVPCSNALQGIDPWPFFPNRCSSKGHTRHWRRHEHWHSLSC